MNVLFFDTETTGKADFRAMPDAKHQPRIVQLAALLCDSTGEEVASLSVIIKPDGWEIPTEAAAIHGITTNYAQEIGVCIDDAVRLFLGLVRAAGELAAHNMEFDNHMIRGEAMRCLVDLERWPSRFCTMMAMTDVCQLPGRYGYKWPKLSEAYKHATGKELEDAHDALADVRACKAVYFWLKQSGLQPATAKAV